MTASSLLHTLHLLAALVWVGGMFFAWMILRPAIIAALEGPLRLKLWVQVFPRFFAWVWAAIVILPVTGVAIARLDYPSLELAPRYVQAMMGLYVVMVALFLRIHSLQLPELQQAVKEQRWAEGAGVLGRIRRVVGINLLIGLGVVVIAVARPGF